MLSTSQLDLIFDFIQTIRLFTQPWKANLLYEIVSDIVLETNDTSHDGHEAFLPGTITQTKVVKHTLRIQAWQDDDFSHFFEMPSNRTAWIDIPHFNFDIPLPLTESTVGFYKIALRNMLLENAPTQEDWDTIKNA